MRLLIVLAEPIERARGPVAGGELQRHLGLRRGAAQCITPYLQRGCGTRTGELEPGIELLEPGAQELHATLAGRGFDQQVPGFTKGADRALHLEVDEAVAGDPLVLSRLLAKALEAKDGYTASHSARVARYSELLGKYIGLDPETLTALHNGALMHDLGKIGIPDAILNKPSTLSDAEYAIMKEHPANTAKIMRPLKRFRIFADIAAWHHERWDGQGYPDKLQGEAIPLLARIVAIADTWDAMTSDRVYRKGMPKARALEIFSAEQYSGQWDPVLTGKFISMIREINKI